MKQGEEKKAVNGYGELLGEIISVSDGYNIAEMKITGVYKTDIDKENYAKFKGRAKLTPADEVILSGRNNLIISMGFVSPGFKFPEQDGGQAPNAGELNLRSDIIYGVGRAGEIGRLVRMIKILKASENDLSAFNIYWGKNEAAKTELKENEVIIYASALGKEAAPWSASYYKDEFDKIDKNMVFGWQGNNRNYSYTILDGIQIKVVGIYLDESDYGTFIFSDEIYAYAEKLASAPANVVIKLSDDWNKNRELFNYLDSTERGTNGVYMKLLPYSSVTDILLSANDYVSILKKYIIILLVGFQPFRGAVIDEFYRRRRSEQKEGDRNSPGDRREERGRVRYLFVRRPRNRRDNLYPFIYRRRRGELGDK